MISTKEIFFRLSVNSFIVLTSGILNFISIILAGRLFLVDDLASYLTILSLGTIISPFISWNLNETLSFYIGRDNMDKNSTRRVLLNIILKYFLLSMALACILFFTSKFFNFFQINIVISAILLTLSRITFDAVYRSIISIEASSRFDIWYLIAMGMAPIIGIIVGYQAGPVVVIICISLVTLVSAILSFLFFFGIEKIYINPFKEIPKYYYRYGIPRIPALFGYAFLMGSPVILIQGLTENSEIIARVGVIMSMLRMLSIAGSPISYLVIPRFQNLYRPASGKATKKIFLVLPAVMLMILIILTFLVYLIGPYIVNFVLNISIFYKYFQTDILFLGFGAVLIIIIFRPLMDGFSAKPYSGTILGSMSLASLSIQIFAINESFYFSIIISLLTIFITAGIYMILFFQKIVLPNIITDSNSF